MAGELLHEYSLDLCEYVLGQIRPHLRELPARPRSSQTLDYASWHRLDMAAWLGRAVAALPGPLADHVWAGVDGAKVASLLSDAELTALAVAVDDPPMRCEGAARWLPFAALHQRAVECIPEIRSGMTKQTAEEWAVDSAGFAARLCEEGRSLSDGIDVVREWLHRARRLLEVMGAAHASSDPHGTHPAPTRPRPRRGRPRGDTARGENEAPAPVMLSPADISARYSVSRSTTYSACRAGLLPHYRVPSKSGVRGKYLIREADLHAWLETLKTAGGPPPSASAPASSGSPAEPFSELDGSRLARAWQAR